MQHKSKPRPPCPDPERYIWVQRRTSGFWRVKRGTHKPAVLNEVMAANANNMRLTMPAAREMLDKLAPFTSRFDKDSRAQRLAIALGKGISEKGELTYEPLLKFEMQKNYPLEDLLKGQFKTAIDKDIFSLEIKRDHWPVEKKNKIVSQYYFELILLTGLPGENDSLRTESDMSPLYAFAEQSPVIAERVAEIPCRLSMQLPADKPYILFLKAGCRERNLPASHPKHYGMQVVKWG